MENMSRRQALRAGAVVGAGVWVVPALTVLGMGPASADTPSVLPTTTNTGSPPGTTEPVGNNPGGNNPGGNNPGGDNPGGDNPGNATVSTADGAVKGEAALSRAVPVAAAGGGQDSLAFTGADVAAVGALGAALVVGGAAAVKASRASTGGAHRD